MTEPARRAVVTGATRGIGEAVVRRLLADGVSVACCGRDVAALERLRASTADLPGSLVTRRADLADWAELDGFLAAAEADLGGVDILVNNAGWALPRDFLAMDEDADWAPLLRLDLLAAVRCTRVLLPGMLERRWGRIVMVSSVAAKYPSALFIDYAAAKAALTAVGTALAREYADRGVTVNSVLPGMVMTPGWEASADRMAQRSGTTAQEVLDGVAAAIPAGRMGEGSEVADLVAFLVSDEARYLTGAAVDVDGGWSPHTF